MPPSDTQYEAELAIRTQVQEEMRREEMLWHQKSKITWLITKDLDTRHFHLSTLIRRTIDSIKTSTGRWLNRRRDGGDIFVQHFTDIYKTLSIGEIIHPVITSNDNFMLC